MAEVKTPCFSARRRFWHIGVLMAILLATYFVPWGKYGSSSSSTTPTDLIKQFYQSLPPTKQAQIDNFIAGTGLMLNIHITHHAGTHVCAVLGHHVELANGYSGTPSFACMGDRENVMNGTFDQNWPWKHDEVAANIAKTRPYFHFISWEFGVKHRPNPLAEVDWEDPNLLSIIVVKDPLDRMLSFWKDGRCTQELGYKEAFAQNHRNGNYSELTHEDWWTCAKGEVPHPRVIPNAVNNYGLKVLADGNGCCQGADTDRKHLDYAKAVVDRMTIILDVECLNAGIRALANLTSLELNFLGGSKAKKLEAKMQSAKHAHASARDKIGYDDVYEYLREKNKLETEFYEWAKAKALVNCDTV